MNTTSYDAAAGGLLALVLLGATLRMLLDGVRGRRFNPAAATVTGLAVAGEVTLIVVLFFCAPLPRAVGLGFLAVLLFGPPILRAARAIRSWRSTARVEPAGETR